MTIHLADDPRRKPSESELSAAIMQYLQLRDYFAWRTHTGHNRPSVPGIPDIVASRGGRTVYIEVKTEDGKLSREQVECHSRLMQKGAEVFVVHSLDELRDLV